MSPPMGVLSLGVTQLSVYGGPQSDGRGLVHTLKEQLVSWGRLRPFFSEGLPCLSGKASLPSAGPPQSEEGIGTPSSFDSMV